MYINFFCRGLLKTDYAIGTNQSKHYMSHSIGKVSLRLGQHFQYVLFCSKFISML